MNGINSLKRLINLLEKEEIKNLKGFLMMSDNKSDSKSILLLEVILSEENLTNSEVQKYLYKKNNYHAYNKLLNRLKEKIFEVITFDINLSRKKYSKRNQIVFQLRKAILQADILQLKGDRDEVPKMYKKIKDKAQLYELYDVQMQALYGLQRFYSNYSNLRKALLIKNDLSTAENCWMNLNKSQVKFNEIINKISLSTSYHSYAQDLSDALIILNECYSYTKSPLIKYYYNTLKAESLQNKNDYSEAGTCFNELLDLCIENPSVYTKNRHGNALINLANNYLYTYDFDSSIIYANQSKEYFKNTPFTLILVDEILFFAFYYLQSIEECELLINSFFQNPYSSSNNFVYNKFKYYQACLMFIRDDYKSSIKILSEIEEIEKDKEGFNISIRLLIIMNKIELKDFDSIEFDINNFTRFINRLRKRKLVSLRFLYISRILENLVNVNFDFTKVISFKKKYFLALNSNEGEYKWTIKSPELIIFHKWIESKVSGTFYKGAKVLGRPELLKKPVSKSI